MDECRKANMAWQAAPGGLGRRGVEDRGQCVRWSPLNASPIFAHANDPRKLASPSFHQPATQREIEI
jgi:hypothetical protein